MNLHRKGLNIVYVYSAILSFQYYELNLFSFSIRKKIRSTYFTNQNVEVHKVNDRDEKGYMVSQRWSLLTNEKRTIFRNSNKEEKAKKRKSEGGDE
jgi:hypothetical protein